ncbi:hypothetical protein YSA_05345 [Pseudomonas putida ND6]|uniref:Uncharacterized protein n=1 Tax=Pseudomonas putida ND6 TaxID=231023 RepID=I3UVY2_PSEPU|nr:hypothetical protein YSA_05345 [Pseudomonas putida ND6]
MAACEGHGNWPQPAQIKEVAFGCLVPVRSRQVLT